MASAARQQQRGERERAATLALHEPHVPAVLLARVLGTQYVVGGVLALLWVLGPNGGPEHGRDVVVALGVAALGLGAGMWAVSATRGSVTTLRAVLHGCIVSAQVVIASGFAATADASNPLLMFLLWTTPYAGVFSWRARWAHTASTITCLVVAGAVAVGSGVPVYAATISLTITVLTVVIVTALLGRVTDALQEQALTDPLTGLHNRRAFSALLEGALSARAAGDVAIVLVDLDRFKNVNDTYGHHAGDELLLALAPRLLELAGPGEVVARLGGDEFAVLLEHAGEAEALAAATRLSRAWAEPMALSQGTVVVQGSVGVALAGRGTTPATLLRDADAAMYRSKAARTGAVQLFLPEMHEAAARQLSLESALRLALAHDQLAVHYQPVVHVSAHGRAVTGVEALVRWDHPELGAVPPSEFVPVAEATGLVGALGARVAERALGDLAAWRAQGLVPDDFQVAVNVSAHQLRDDLPDVFRRALEQHDLPARCLGVEITESAVVQGPDAERVLHEVRRLGCTLLLDDFGTGESSLSRLQRLPFDVLKIDRSFVADLSAASLDRSLVAAVRSVAQALGLRVVAEGVETEDQQDLLLSLGCDVFQGWLYARAVPAHEVGAVLRQLTVASGAARVPAPRVAPDLHTLR